MNFHYDSLSLSLHLFFLPRVDDQKRVKLDHSTMTPEAFYYFPSSPPEGHKNRANNWVYVGDDDEPVFREFLRRLEC